MDDVQVLCVPIISFIVYWVINLLKYALNNNEKFKRFIPLLSALLGSVCGVICIFIMPNAIHTTNILEAIIYGAASGLSATGCNQIIKQFSKDNEDNIG